MSGIDEHLKELYENMKHKTKEEVVDFIGNRLSVIARRNGQERIIFSTCMANCKYQLDVYNGYITLTCLSKRRWAGHPRGVQHSNNNDHAYLFIQIFTWGRPDFVVLFYSEDKDDIEELKLISKLTEATLW